MKKNFILLFVIILSSCSSMNKDFNNICVEAEKIQQNKDLNKNQKINQFYSSIQKLDLKDGTRKFINDLAHQSVISYENFEEFAQEQGIENWKCESLKQLFNE